jgi:hypothetical protein
VVAQNRLQLTFGGVVPVSFFDLAGKAARDGDLAILGAFKTRPAWPFCCGAIS